MDRRIWMAFSALLAITLLTTACGDIDRTVEELNRSATQLAGGTVDDNSGVTEGASDGAQLPPGETPVPEVTEAAGMTYDLPVTGDTLAHTWGQIYALASGTNFTITASERQVSDYVIERLQATGWDANVHGGSVTISGGQLRVDLALENESGDFGGGAVSFQPTLDAASSLRLNAQGGDFGGLRMPGNFTTAIGDAVYAALTGAPNAQTSSVTLTELTLDAGTMRVSGTVR